MSGRNSAYPPVSSAIRNIPVRGACMTPAMTPAIPRSVKFFSGTTTPKELMFHTLAKKNPMNPPMKREGANVPPQPPLPFVADVANTLVRITMPTYNTRNSP